MNVQGMTDGSVVYFGSQGIIQSYELASGVLLHVCRGIASKETADFVVHDIERQLRKAGRCTLMVDGNIPLFTTEFREALTEWLCANDDVTVHMLTWSNQVEMALGIVNLAMGTPRALAYFNAEEWEAIGRALVPSFVRRPLSIPADFHSGAWVAALESLSAGDLAAALRLAREAIDLADLVGFVVPRLASRCLCGRLLLEAGRFDEARSVLDEALAGARRAESLDSECISLLLLAELESKTGGDAAAVRTMLARAFELARETGALNTPWLSRDSIADLCVQALQANLEVEHVRDLVRQLGLVPRVPPLHVTHWPWLLRLETLGNADVTVEGRSLGAGKAAELLFAVFAFGGSAVPRQTVEAALWPDADGDRAHGALKTTLHRLRQAAGGQDFIRLVDGRLVVDGTRCWSDLAAVTEVMDRAKASFERDQSDPRPATASALADRLFGLYRGRFLADHPADWTVSVRERLHQRFLATVATLGKHFETHLLFDSAVELYERALLVDDLSEPIHRGVMLSHEKMGRAGEALRAYERCRRVLLANMNVEPSTEARAIRSRLSGATKRA